MYVTEYGSVFKLRELLLEDYYFIAFIFNILNISQNCLDLTLCMYVTEYGSVFKLGKLY
jgi:hypothetical protein